MQFTQSPIYIPPQGTGKYEEMVERVSERTHEECPAHLKNYLMYSICVSVLQCIFGVHH